jgi:hypothetical protein
VDVISPSGRPFSTGDPVYERAAHGCPHGTMSHYHDASESGVTANYCGLPKVGMCAGGTRQGKYCRCVDATDQLDGDGTCVDLYDADCPGSTCQLTEFDTDWLILHDIAEADAVYDDYESLELSTRVDAFCDDTDFTNDNCASPPSYALNSTNGGALPTGKKADYYFLHNYYEFDFGGNDEIDGGGVTERLATGGSTTTVTTGVAMTLNEYAGGKAYIRWDTADWQMRDIVSNTTGGVVTVAATANGVNVGNWTTPVAGDQVGLLRSGSSIKKHGVVSAAVVDLRIQAAREWAVASMYSLLRSMNIAEDWPIRMNFQLKPTIWMYHQEDANHYSPCDAGKNWHAQEHDFELPTAAGGEGDCDTGHGGSPFGSPYGAGEYEEAICDMLLRALDQADDNVLWDNIKITTVSAAAANTIALHGGIHTGICPQVLRHAKYAGARDTVVTSSSVP